MSTTNATLTIRKLGPEDAAALEQLRALEGRPVPDAPLLGAVVEGQVLAAVSLASGETLADPFSRTAELLSLLRLRAEQLERRDAAPRHGLLRRRAPGRPGGRRASAFAAVHARAS